jgi:hypothetical protein
MISIKGIANDEILKTNTIIAEFATGKKDLPLFQLRYAALILT